jgi:hypothetical protein
VDVLRINGVISQTSAASPCSLFPHLHMRSDAVDCLAVATNRKRASCCSDNTLYLYLGGARFECLSGYPLSGRDFRCVPQSLQADAIGHSRCLRNKSVVLSVDDIWSSVVK